MRRAALVGLALFGLGCAPAIPDPAHTARDFARACARGDAETVQRMLSDDQRRALDARAVATRLREGGAEGIVRCKALAEAPLAVQGHASMTFATGESATVVYEGGTPRIAAAGAMPGGGATPEAALASFRSSIVRLLAGPSLGPLTSSARQRTSERLRALATGLARPDALFIDVAGDRAKVDLDAGHFVSLRREAGLWRVESFE